MAITKVVTKRALIVSIRENIEERFKESNLKALKKGYELGSTITGAL
jgi:Pyruvate/2-oxoacid:ferredoxin oxidoreductase gamma subunit